MNLIQLAQCAFGKHHRDRRRARLDGGTYRSYCTGCGKPMVREAGGWSLAVDHGAG